MYLLICLFIHLCELYAYNTLWCLPNKTGATKRLIGDSVGLTPKIIGQERRSLSGYGDVHVCQLCLDRTDIQYIGCLLVTALGEGHPYLIWLL